MLKAEIFEDKALLLDYRGRVWQVNLGRDDQPEIRLLEALHVDTVKGIMAPQLSSHVRTV